MPKNIISQEIDNLIAKSGSPLYPYLSDLRTKTFCTYGTNNQVRVSDITAYLRVQNNSTNIYHRDNWAAYEGSKSLNAGYPLGQGKGEFMDTQTLD